MTMSTGRGPTGPIEEQLSRIAGDLAPVDAGRRQRFLSLVASRKAEARAWASRPGWPRRLALAAATGGLLAASLVGVTAAGGVDEVIGRVTEKLANTPLFGRAQEEPTAVPVPATQPLDGARPAGRPDSGIDTSNASDTGREHANPNAVDGADNEDDRGGNRRTDVPAQAGEQAGKGGSSHEATPGPPDATPRRGPRAR